MDIECPMCLGKILPFKVREGNLVFLCISKKCSFPVGYDYLNSYQFQEEDFPACLVQAQSRVSEYRVNRLCQRRKKTKNFNEVSESTDLDN